MSISFSNPLMLLFIPICITFVFFIARSNKVLFNRKKRLWILRSFIFILLILALSGMNIKTYVDTVTTIFAVDISESTNDVHEKYKSFITESMKNTHDRDRVAVVTFGKNAQVEIPIVKSLDRIDFEANVGLNNTNLEEGLKLSRALIPQNTRKRIVLLTDGEENLGEGIKEAQLFKRNDISLKVFKTNKDKGYEVQLENMSIPKTLYENQRFDISLNIFSNIKTKCNIILYSGESVIGEKLVTVEKGDNRFIFSDKAEKAGFKSFKAMIIPEKDTITQNNSYSAFTSVKGKAKVLLIDGENQGGRELNKILTTSGIDVDYIKDKQVPHNLSELVRYKSVIMSDVSLENINNDFIDSLKVYVKEYGGGLLVTGGENSYALGGYYNTPLEDILPVDMQLKVDGEVPSLGLVLVIDKSGSMSGGQYGINKIDMAKEAAVKAVNSLKPKDKIGVVAFDGSAYWVANMSSTSDEKKIKNAISTIGAGGGTSIIPALDEAYKALKDTDTKLKHIILLTDGHAESSGYGELLDNINEENITISTVAVGQGSDTGLLEYIADIGNGRYYFVDEYTNIPKIFTKETFLASKAYINNRYFTPTIERYNDVLNSLNGKALGFYGYVGASAKDRAEVILKSDKDDPILAIWQYGLGRTVAWTSDINGRWSKEYLSTDEGIEFIDSVVEWTMPRFSDGNLSVQTELIGDKIVITASNVNGFEESYKTDATIIGPDNQTYDIKLKPVKPGEYKGQVEIFDKGVYIAKITQYKDDELVNIANEGIAINYSKEYDINTTQNRLDQIVNIADGKFITNPNEVFTNDLENVYNSRDISSILIIISLILFIIDIALRRLNIKFTKLDSFKIKALDKTHSIKNNIKNSSKTDKKLIDKNKQILNNKTENKKKKTKKQGNKEDKKHSTNEAKLNTSRLLKAKNKSKR